MPWVRSRVTRRASYRLFGTPRVNFAEAGERLVAETLPLSATTEPYLVALDATLIPRQSRTMPGTGWFADRPRLPGGCAAPNASSGSPGCRCRMPGGSAGPCRCAGWRRSARRRWPRRTTHPARNGKPGATPWSGCANAWTGGSARRSGCWPWATGPTRPSSCWPPCRSGSICSHGGAREAGHCFICLQRGPGKGARANTANAPSAPMPGWISAAGGGTTT